MGVRKRDKREMSWRYGAFGKGGEVFWDASGGEQLEHFMTPGVRVTKGKMTAYCMFAFREMSKCTFCQSPNVRDVTIMNCSKLRRGFLFPKLISYISSSH